MEKSLYFEYVQKFFPQLVLSIVEKLNEKRNNSLTYMYRQMLTPRFSADGRWSSVLAEYTRVAADVVSLDSELPLKSRDSIEVAHGDIPKLGMKLYMTEKQLSDLDAMIAQQLPLNQILRNMFSDAPRCIEGIYERLEDLFLSMLSTGVALSTRNDGSGIRLNMGYLDANKFAAGATAFYTKDASGKVTYNTSANAMDAIEKVFDKALEDQHTITDVYMDDYALRALYNNDQVKQQFAFLQNFVGANIPTLNLEQVSQIFMSRWNVRVHRVSRAIKTEINGKKVNHNPWQEGMMVFTCDENVGDLVYTFLAEQTRPVDGVVYENVDEFILASRYSTNDPLREYTSSQARVVPIINNVDQIYQLDTTLVEA